jgi:hypothetical protein
MLWPAFIRILIGILLVVLVVGTYLVLNPDALRGLILMMPGVGEAPLAGEIAPPPVILVPSGPLPGGYRAFGGTYNGNTFSCGFLLDLEDGRRVAVNAAHSIPHLPPQTPGELWAPDGKRAALLKGQIAYGQIFSQNRFSMDYVLWTVADDTAPEYFLKPDPRQQVEPGERVWVYSLSENGAGGSKLWPGAVMSAAPDAIWIQLEDSFNPAGFSGCPVISQHTGRVLGMAVSGANQPPVVMGLHPVASLVEKARKAFPGP